MLFPKSLKDTLAESSENRSVINRPTESKYYENYMWTDRYYEWRNEYYEWTKEYYE